MALQVWLPLNGNLNNQGLNGSVTTPSTGGGVEVDNNGRIEQCYSFNNGYLSMPAPLSSNTPKFTICTWVYVSSLQNSYGPIYNSRTAVSGKGIVFWMVNNGFRIDDGAPNSDIAYTYPKNTWIHVCYTRNTSKKKIYLNGELVATQNSGDLSGVNTTAWIGKDQMNPGTYYLNGKICDLRIYDNELTPSDIKAIYQTKIWDIMPYTHMGREFLFDRSGYMLMPLVNTGTTWHGNALYFDGSSRMRPRAGNVGFNLTGGTMSVWFTPKVIPSDYRIIYVDSTSKFGLGFYTTTSMILCSGDQARTSVVTSSFTAGKLYNMIVSYDSGYTAIKAYLNGTSLTPSSNNNWGESNGLTLGGRTLNSTSWFNGKVHKVDIFKNQLTAAECIELYNKERTNFLPDEYVQLEYLEGTGTQWINTEYLINADNLPKLRYTLDAEATNTAVGNRWWVCGVGGGSLTFHVGIGNGSTSTFPFTYGKGVSDATTSAYGSIGDRYRWELDMEKQTYKVWSSTREKLADVAFTRQSPTASLQQTLPLFRWIRYQGNTSTPNGYIFGMKIYGMEMYEDSKPKRNMIPAKRKSDGVLGMYDTVTKKFFTNAGTGTFVAGPEW